MRGDFADLSGGIGIGIANPATWIRSSGASLLASLASMAFTGALMIYLNRVYNVLRSLTSMVAGMYFVMLTSLPQVIDTFYAGDLAALLLLLCVALMFSTYADPNSQRRIFLIFFLITLAGLTDFAFALYLPVFLIGCVQMRTLSLRTFLAALLGAITPPWILLGFGWINIEDLHWPQISYAWSALNDPDTLKALAVTGFTIFCAIGFTIANLLKILSYNARTRAFNGLLTLLLTATILFILVNFSNFTFYFPLLCALTAYQIAHFFTYRRTRRSYIPILLLMAAYIALYFWNSL